MMFQSDQPMLPFMADELHTSVWIILGTFVETSVLDEVTTAGKLSRIDIFVTEYVVSSKKVGTGS